MSTPESYLEVLALGDDVEFRVALVYGRVSVNATTSDGSTLLHVLCRHGREDLARIAVAAGAAIDAHDAYGFQPLHLACLSGQARLVRYLLLRGADPNARSVYGTTAMHSACAGGDAGAVQVLVDAGAIACVSDDDDVTPSEVAAHYGHFSLYERVAALARSQAAERSTQHASPSPFMNPVL